MKTQTTNHKFFAFTLVIILIVLGVQGSSYGQRLNVGEPRTVRLIYFLPNDRPFRAGVVRKMKDEIISIQTFFADQMQAHRYENKTFRFETDAKGKPRVHRVNGQYSDSHYLTNGGYWEEIYQRFDREANNVYFAVWDNSTGIIAEGVGGTGGGGKSAGHLTVPGGFTFGTAAHELGHAFGLGHDFRNGEYIMSYGPGRYQLSACAAEFLAVHPYFNPNIPIEEGMGPTIELISERTYPVGSESIKIRLKVSDTEGLHQVQLFSFAALNTCRRLAGQKNAIVEFEYDGVTSRTGYTSLSSVASHPFRVEAIDRNGNVSVMSFLLREISPHHIATLQGHTELVQFLVFSPDSKKIASGGSPIRLWDVATERTIATFDGRTVAFSPDGAMLASGISKTVTLWDVMTQRAIDSLKAHTDEGATDWVLSLTFSPNGKKIASGSYNGTIRLWDVATRTHIATLNGHTAGILSVAFSPDGEKIASGSYDGTIKLWDVATGANIATFAEEGLAPWIYSVAFSPDGKTLASGRGNGRGNVRLWDITTKRNIAFYQHIFGVISVAFSPDGKTLASASRDGLVTLRNVDTGTEIAVFPHTSGVWSVAFSPNGATLASGTWDGTVELWDLPPEVLVAEFQRPPMYWVDASTRTLQMLTESAVRSFAPEVQDATSLAVDVADSKIYWTEKSGNRKGKIRRANLDGTNVQLIKPLTSVPLSIALDIANRKIYLTNAWGKVQRMNFDGSNFQPNLIKGLQTPNHLTLDVTRGKIYWTEQTSDRIGKIRRANLDGTNVELVKDLTSAPRGIALDTTNRKIYLTNASGKVQRMNLNGSSFQPNLITRLESLEGIAVDAVNRKLYWTEKGSIRRANLNGKNIQNVVTGLANPIDLVLGTDTGTAPVAAAPVVVLPDTTGLLPNYPNPFNPETWIPYQLAKPTDVTLHIYTTNGTLIRTLALGHQPAGNYQNRNRAAHWDGRNGVGEKVASGVYFYTLTAGNFAATRKMLIMK